MKMNKKAFTLIELLAVIVVLGIIMFLTIPKINDLYNKYKQKVYYESTNRLVKSFEEYYVRMVTKNMATGCSYEFFADYNDCTDFSFDGNRPIDGEIELSALGEINGCIIFDKYSYSIDNSIVSITESCSVILPEYVYDYTGGEQEFIVPKTGYYKLEVWGAQGGSYNTTYIGGYGGYSSGSIKLNRNDKLYINVGGEGKSGAATELKVYGDGGYNGGGARSGWNCSTCAYGSSGGGGATHIAKVSGLLSSLESEKGTFNESAGTYTSEKILIVAGGGGGNGYTNSGTNINSTNIASGGGFEANYGATPSSGKGGSPGKQNSGAGFGQGGSCTAGVCDGGGGGFYGGQRGTNNAGGGSGYIGNSSLIDKVMYCYNCTESSNASTKTISTTSVSHDAVSNNAKKGNGYAKITYLGSKL